MPDETIHLINGTAQRNFVDLQVQTQSLSKFLGLSWTKNWPINFERERRKFCDDNYWNADPERLIVSLDLCAGVGVSHLPPCWQNKNTFKA